MKTYNIASILFVVPEKNPEKALDAEVFSSVPPDPIPRPTGINKDELNRMNLQKSAFVDWMIKNRYSNQEIVELLETENLEDLMERCPVPFERSEEVHSLEPNKFLKLMESFLACKKCYEKSEESIQLDRIFAKDLCDGSENFFACEELRELVAFYHKLKLNTFEYESGEKTGKDLKESLNNFYLGKTMPVTEQVKELKRIKDSTFNEIDLIEEEVCCEEYNHLNDMVTKSLCTIRQTFDQLVRFLDAFTNIQIMSSQSFNDFKELVLFIEKLEKLQNNNRALTGIASDKFNFAKVNLKEFVVNVLGNKDDGITSKLPTNFLFVEIVKHNYVKLQQIAALLLVRYNQTYTNKIMFLDFQNHNVPRSSLLAGASLGLAGTSMDTGETQKVCCWECPESRLKIDSFRNHLKYKHKIDFKKVLQKSVYKSLPKFLKDVDEVNRKAIFDQLLKDFNATQMDEFLELSHSSQALSAQPSDTLGSPFQKKSYDDSDDDVQIVEDPVEAQKLSRESKLNEQEAILRKQGVKPKIARKRAEENLGGIDVEALDEKEVSKKQKRIEHYRSEGKSEAEAQKLAEEDRTGISLDSDED